MQRYAKQNTKPVAGKIDDLLTRADQQWQRGELRSAFHLFLAAAKQGDATAQLDLGYFYDTGTGIKPNRSLALRWYKQAYRQGRGAAASNIGTIFRDEGRLRQALAWFERAAKLGDSDANLEIARILLHRKRAEEAIPYLKRVVSAEPGLEVTEASHEEATGLLKTCLFTSQA